MKGVDAVALADGVDHRGVVEAELPADLGIGPAESDEAAADLLPGRSEPGEPAAPHDILRA